jgi:hypothetical protein
MMWLGLYIQTPTEDVEQIFGYMIAFLQALGLWDWVIGSFMVIIILGLTMRVLEALGSKG